MKTTTKHTHKKTWKTQHYNTKQKLKTKQQQKAQKYKKQQQK